MKKKFIELRSKGTSFSKIAENLKVSKTTLIDWSKDFEREILNLRAIEMEELQQMYYVQKQKRIELFGKQLTEVNKELKQRDFTCMTTERLLELQIKYLDYLKKEESELYLQVEEQNSLDKMLIDYDKSLKYLRV